MGPLVSMEIDTWWHFLACLAKMWRHTHTHILPCVSPLSTTDSITLRAHIGVLAADTDLVRGKTLASGNLSENIKKCGIHTPLSRIIRKSANQTLSKGISRWEEVNTENSLFWSPTRAWFGPKLYPRRPDQQRWRIQTLCRHQGGGGGINDTETDGDT